MRLMLAILAALTLSACATTGGDPRDPWEGLNRKTFAFNDALDRAVMKPIAQGYQKVTPAFAQEGVNNFYSNLGDIGTTLNNLLQGKLKEGAGDGARFLVNTEVGVFGLWDIATPMGLEKRDEEFGQALAWRGVRPRRSIVSR